MGQQNVVKKNQQKTGRHIQCLETGAPFRTNS